jgi:hypothetical protein
MAWPGDAGSAPPSGGAMDPIGLVFRVGPELWPLRAEIQAMISTIDRYWSDPELRKLIAEAPEIATFVSKAISDPALKSAFATVVKLTNILSKG